MGKPRFILCFFKPAFNEFHWYGKTQDKLGKYMMLKTGNQMTMELKYNYTREKTYTVVGTEGTGDALTTFVLKSHKTGQVHSFSRA